MRKELSSLQKELDKFKRFTFRRLDEISGIGGSSSMVVITNQSPRDQKNLRQRKLLQNVDSRKGLANPNETSLLTYFDMRATTQQQLR